MPRNPEKENWSQLSSREKREIEEKLEQEQKKPKVTGLEKLEAKKRIAEGKVMEDQETAEKKAAEEELAKAYPEPEDKEKELEKLVKETENELAKKIDREKKLSGKELSNIEIYHLTRDFYREKLGYKIEHKGFLGGRVRLKDKEGKYILEEKIDKPVEFKKVPISGAETPLVKFLKEKYKNNIKGELEKKAPERDKEEYKKWKEHFGPLAEAWQEQEEFEKEIDGKSDKLMEEKKDELAEKIEQERKKAGRKLSDTEIYTLSRNFYLDELGYEIRYRGLLGGKARIWNKEKGGYLIDEKTGKAVEFKTAFSPKGERPFLKFLEKEYEDKVIKRDLRTKYQGKTEKAPTVEEVSQEKGQTPIEQVEQKEETGRESKAEEVKLKEKTKETWKGIDFRRMETEGAFEKIKEMDIDKNSRGIMGIIKDYYGSEVLLPPYAGSLLRTYDQLRSEKDRFEKVKDSPESLKRWIAVFLTEIKDSGRVKKLRETELEAKKRGITVEQLSEAIESGIENAQKNKERGRSQEK